MAASFFGGIEEMERLSGRLEGMVCCGKQVQRLAELSANSD